MELSSNHLPELVQLFLPEAAPEQRATALAHLKDRIRQGQEAPEDTRVLLGPDDKPVAAIRLTPLRGEEWNLCELAHRRDHVPSQEEIAGLLREALNRAAERGVQRVSTRVDQEVLGAAYESALQETGFDQVDERIEFRTPLEELPAEEAGPFEWRTLDQVGLEAAATVLVAAAQGDPAGGDEEADPAEAIQAFLAEPGMTADPEGLQIGYLEDRPAAFLLAQAYRPTGFGRITYMGLTPEHRGRGLCQAVQLRGIELLRRLGAREYLGGTSTRNAPMLGCFRKTGCREYVRVTEFRWRAPGFEEDSGIWSGRCGRSCL